MQVLFALFLVLLIFRFNIIFIQKIKCDFFHKLNLCSEELTFVEYPCGFMVSRKLRLCKFLLQRILIFFLLLHQIPSSKFPSKLGLGLRLFFGPYTTFHPSRILPFPHHTSFPPSPFLSLSIKFLPYLLDLTLYTPFL